MPSFTAHTAQPAGRKTAWNRLALFLAALCALVCLSAATAFAIGTPAGSTINNRATIDYIMKGSAFTASSNSSSFVVDDKVSFVLTAADVASAGITPGGRAYMTYILTNTGNGSHGFTLNASVSGTPGFVPAVLPQFYTDSAGTIRLPVDSNAGGLPYIGNLAPDAAITVYLFITAPVTAADGQAISYAVTAEAYQPANLGAVNPPLKSTTQAAIDTPANKNATLSTQYVLLADGHGNGGDSDRDGKYAVIARDGGGATIGFNIEAAAVNVVKTVTVTDTFGGTQPLSGATLHYTLNVSATGAGTALDVVITDPIPANSTYLAGTLRLNGTALTDLGDDDAGNVGVTTDGTVTVTLGDMTGITPAHVITFDVRIN